MDNYMIEEELNRDDQTMNTIQQIDEQIKNMYDNLEALSVEKNPNLNKQNNILQKIRELQALKSSLYTSVSNSYASVQSNVAESRNSLVNEVAVGGIIKNELGNAEKNLSALKDARYNKLRMAEINNYYSEKYSAQTVVMKTIVYYCIPILILAILTKKGLVPQNIGILIMGLLVGLALFTIGYQLIDIASRDNMVFSEFEYPFDPNSVNLDKDSNDNDQPFKMDMSLSCAGESCCPPGNVYGTLWDKEKKLCVLPGDKKLCKSDNSIMGVMGENDDITQSEGFIGSKCLESSFDKPDANVNLTNDSTNIMGYAENGGYNYASI